MQIGNHAHMISSQMLESHYVIIFIQDLCKTNLNSFIRIIQITRANRFFNKFIGEFDPGSGRTLAACLTHASRTDGLDSLLLGKLVANG